MLSGDDAIRRGAPADSLSQLPAACCWASLANVPDKGCSDSSLQPADHIVQITAQRQHPPRHSLRGTKIYFFSPFLFLVPVLICVSRRSSPTRSRFPQCQTTTTGERSMHLFPLSDYRMDERIGDDDNEKDRTCPSGGRGVDLRPGLWSLRSRGCQKHGHRRRPRCAFSLCRRR